MNQDTIQLRVHRGGAGAQGRIHEYTLPGNAAASLLDGLRWVRTHQDETLAFRYACINANACKECMMLIDGVVDYACTARLKEGMTTLAPLPKKALIRDLVTEITPPGERLEQSLPGK